MIIILITNNDADSENGINNYNGDGHKDTSATNHVC